MLNYNAARVGYRKKVKRKKKKYFLLCFSYFYNNIMSCTKTGVFSVKKSIYGMNKNIFGIRFLLFLYTNVYENCINIDHKNIIILSLKRKMHQINLESLIFYN